MPASRGPRQGPRAAALAGGAEARRLGDSAASSSGESRVGVTFR